MDSEIQKFKKIFSSCKNKLKSVFGVKKYEKFNGHIDTVLTLMVFEKFKIVSKNCNF